MNKVIDELLKSYPFIGDDIRREQDTLNEYIQLQQEARDTLKGQALTDMPHMPDGNTADPTCDAVERVIDKYQDKIDEQVGKQVAKAAKSSADKIKLSQAVDEMMELVPDNINHPAHYTTGSIEVIDYLQEKMTADMFEGFCIGNALKYLSRYRMKGGLEDLKKAEWYLSKIIGVMETA